MLSGLPPLSYFDVRRSLPPHQSRLDHPGRRISVWIILAYRSGNKARSWAVHEWSTYIIPLVWLSAQLLNVLTVYDWSASDPRVWAVAVAALAVIVGIIPWRRRSMRLSSWFRRAYCHALRQTRSSQTALAQALDIVASTSPFDTLTKSDLDTLAHLFAPLPDPTVLADILVEAQRTKDVPPPDRPALTLRRYMAGEQVQTARAIASSPSEMRHAA